MAPLRPRVVAAAALPRKRRFLDARRDATRLLAAIAFVWMVVASPAAVAAPAHVEHPTTRAAAFGEEILATLNRVRLANGLIPLRRSSGLTAAARQHSSEMARYGYFAHTSPNWPNVAARIARFYPRAGRASWAVGENLLWSTSDLDAAAALELWLRSPGHRRTILTPRWRELGVGVVRTASAPGVYGGRDVVIITADFGVRR